MSSREIALWVDERWYQALSLHLKNETVEDKLNNYLDELISQLPDHTREKISREIWEEDQQREQEIRASRRYSAFRIMENGVTQYFQMDRSVGMLEIAGYIRLRLRQQGEPRSLVESLRGREEISAEEFERMLSSCEESLEYRLNAVEKSALLQKMDAYCQQQTGQSLKEYSAQCMAEDMAPPAGPVM